MTLKQYKQYLDKNKQLQYSCIGDSKENMAYYYFKIDDKRKAIWLVQK